MTFEAGGRVTRLLPETLDAHPPSPLVVATDKGTPSPAEHVYIAGKGLVKTDGVRRVTGTGVLEPKRVDEGLRVSVVAEKPGPKKELPVVAHQSVEDETPGYVHSSTLVQELRARAHLPDETTHWAFISSQGEWFGNSPVARLLWKLGANPVEGRGYEVMHAVKGITQVFKDGWDMFSLFILRNDSLSRRMDALIAMSHADSAKQRKTSEDLGYATEELSAVTRVLPTL